MAEARRSRLAWAWLALGAGLSLLPLWAHPVTLVGSWLAQPAFALVPGTSRSGATILGGLCCGLTREAAARFSFLLSIPSILAAGLYELIEAREELLASNRQAIELAAALVVTAVVGYATIPWLLGFLRKNSTFVFIVYRLLLAALLLALLASGRLSAY